MRTHTTAHGHSPLLKSQLPTLTYKPYHQKAIRLNLENEREGVYDLHTAQAQNHHPFRKTHKKSVNDTPLQPSMKVCQGKQTRTPHF